MIAGYGMVAFRDPHGIRPLVLGSQTDESGKKSYAVASESVAFNALAYDLERDIQPGEAVFVSFDGSIVSRQCSDKVKLSPCLFEYVYFRASRLRHRRRIHLSGASGYGRFLWRKKSNASCPSTISMS